MPLSSPVLVGRQTEITHLLELAAHPPGIALIEGEAGIGKSRVIGELVDRCQAQRRRTLVGRCDPLRDPFPLGPVIHAMTGIGEVPPTKNLSPLSGALRPLLPEFADRLPAQPRPSGDARVDQHLLFRATRELLSALGPVVCVLEDLHWADDATVEFLRYLVAQMPSKLTVVVSYRSHDVGPSSGLPALIARLPPGIASARVCLAPLDAFGVRQLVAAILDVDDVSDEFAGYLHGKTSGVPLAVEEVVRLFRERRALVCSNGRWMRKSLSDLGVPPAIREAILERVGALTPEARRVIEAAAVVEVPADAQLLSEVATLKRDVALEGIRAALHAVLLVESVDGRLQLRHALANQAVYESMPVAIRADLHRRAAEALARLAEPPVVQLAHHYERAGRDAEWLNYAQAAAELATARGDDEAAARYLRRALHSQALPEGARGRVGVALGWAAVRAVSGQAETIAALRRLLAESSLATAERGEIRSLLGSLLRLSGDAAAGCRELVSALKELETRPELAALVMSRLAFPWVEQGHVSEHLRWLDHASATAESQPDARVRFAVRAMRATTLSYLADARAHEGVAAVPWETTSGADGRDLAMACLELTMADILLGHYGQARVRLDDAIRRAHLLGQVSLLDDAESDELLLRWVLGDWDGLAMAARMHADAFAGVANRELPGHLIAGLLALAGNRLEEAETLLERSARVARLAGLIPSFSIAAGGLARLHLERGQPETAWRVAEEPIAVIRRKQIWVWAAEVAPAAIDALVTAGRTTEARYLVAEFRSGIAGRDAPLAHAAVRLCGAALTAATPRPLEADDDFLAAQLAYESLPRPYEAALACERRALARIAAGKVEAGGQELCQVLEQYRTLGAVRDSHRVRVALKLYDLPLPAQERWRGGRRGYGDALSPQQKRVVQMAAEGRTNVEIGAALYLSPRTVEKHLAAAMQKLGVRSRTGLARTWQQGTAQSAIS